MKKEEKRIRIHVELDLLDTRNNVFSLPQLLRRHSRKQQQQQQQHLDRTSAGINSSQSQRNSNTINAGSETNGNTTEAKDINDANNSLMLHEHDTANSGSQSLGNGIVEGGNNKVLLLDQGKGAERSGNRGGDADDGDGDGSENNNDSDDSDGVDADVDENGDNDNEDDEAEEDDADEADDDDEDDDDVDAANMDSEGLDSASSSSSHEAVGQTTTTTTRRPRKDLSNVYDVDDDFIDDSDLFDDSGTSAAAFPNKIKPWQYGFFVWRGPVENVHHDISFKDYFEPQRAPTQKQKRNTATSIKKSSSQATPARVIINAANAPTLLASNAAATAVTPSAQINPADASSGSTSSIKRKRQNTTGKAAAAGSSHNAGDGGDESTGAGSNFASDPTVPPPSKKKKGGGGVSTVDSHAVLESVDPSDTAAATGDNEQDEGEDSKKGKKKLLIPLSPAVEIAVKYLKTEREKESFENKKNFPERLRPPLLEAAKTAVLNNQMNENFVRHLKKVLPYNTFTLKRLVGRMLLNYALMKSKVALELKTAEFQALVNAMCLQQGIEGPQEVAGSNSAEPIDPTTGERKKFRFSEESKLAFWNILVLEWEQVELKNLHDSLDSSSNANSSNTGSNISPVNLNNIPSAVKLTDANVRKAVYPKLVQFWPAGWMTSNDLSREYSLFKRRINTRAGTAAPGVD
ncbi:hypothetical protein HK100_005582, partial [Physocladia obscura]